jgi:3-oxoadipate enol-lactonase
VKIEAPPWREIHLPGLGPLRIRDSGPPEGAPDAPTILLIHGWTVSADLNWCRTYEPIARRARVVAWDQRGHGAGGLRTSGRMRMEALADDAAAVVRALGVDRATAVGYSMGGAVAQAMWRRHPDLLDGLVLCATAMAFGLTTTERRDFAIMGASSLPARLAAALGREELGWQAARRASERQAGTSMETGDADFDRWAWDETRAGSLHHVLRAAWNLGRFDSSDWIHEVDVPHVVVVCGDDDVVPTARQRQLAHALPDATILEIDADHAACVLRPDLFVPALDSALDAVHGPAPR